MKDKKVLLNVILRLTEGVWEQLEDERGEFNFALDELVSHIVSAAVLGLIEKEDGGCLYERIDWVEMKRQGLCE